MATMKVSTEKIDEASFDIFVDDSGSFSATFDGETYSGDSKKRLVDKLREAVRTHQRVSVPATMIERAYDDDKPPTLTNVDLTGLHARSRNVLYREVGTGKTGQWQSYRGDTLRRLTPAEAKTYLDLWRVKRAAEVKLDAWVKAREIDPRQAVTDAMQAVLAGQAK